MNKCNCQRCVFQAAQSLKGRSVKDIHEDLQSTEICMNCLHNGLEIASQNCKCKCHETKMKKCYRYTNMIRDESEKYKSLKRADDDIRAGRLTKWIPPYDESKCKRVGDKHCKEYNDGYYCEYCIGILEGKLHIPDTKCNIANECDQDHYHLEDVCSVCGINWVSEGGCIHLYTGEGDD